MVREVLYNPQSWGPMTSFLPSALKDLPVTSYVPLNFSFLTYKSIVTIIHFMLERTLDVESEYVGWSLSPDGK